MLRSSDDDSLVFWSDEKVNLLQNTPGLTVYDQVIIAFLCAWIRFNDSILTCASPTVDLIRKTYLSCIYHAVWASVLLVSVLVCRYVYVGIGF